MKTNHIASLDGLRGVAAIMVVLYHSAWWLPGAPLFRSGYLAVDFFFCLSGFVISYAYDARLQQGMTVWTFFKARLLRLYPMIAIGTALSALIFAYLSHIAHMPPVQMLTAILLPFAALPNFFQGGSHTEIFPVNGPLWSLFFEIAINMVYAMLFRFLTGRIIVALEMGLFLWLCVAAGQHGFSHLGHFSDTFIGGIPRTGFSFFAGVLIARAFAAGKLPKIPVSAPMLAAALVFMLTIDWTFIGALPVDIFCVAILFPLMVMAGCRQELSGWRLRFALILGAISYPIYATHEPILFIMQHILWHTVVHVGSPHLAFAILFIALINWLFLRFYDKPLRRYLAA